MADLFAHLRSVNSPIKPKSFPGNQPAVVSPSADGSLLLSAANCEIYGPSLILEPQYRNLGYWSSEEDRAVWTINVPRGGKYAVWLDYACDRGAAGNKLVLQANEDRLTTKVASTGTWDTYREAQIGVIALQAGRQRLIAHSEGKITGALIDLKSIRLVPQK